MNSASRSCSFPRRHRRHRQGAIFIVALGVVLILTSVVLVMVQAMRTEATASANRLSMAEADAIEQAGEMWVLGQVETYTADAVTVTTTPAEAIQVGNGYFWVISPDPTQDQTLRYGITDEASKVNLNANWGLLPEQLALLPGMTQEIGDNIVAWNGTQDPAGASTDYYQSLPEAYSCKALPFETVEELMLVEDMTPQILFGEDLNQNGVIEPAEQTSSGGITLTIGSGTDTRGLLDYVTCFSTDLNTTVSGGARASVDISTNNQQAITALQTALSTAISSSRATAIINQLMPQLPARGQAATWDLGQFYTASGMTPQEFGEAFDYLSSARPQKGLVNVNTASQQVFAALPGLAQGEGTTIAASRSGADQSNIGWFFSAINSSEIAQVAPYVTNRSYVYSADIVAVSGDGRAFKRERIVVNVAAEPAKIVYRKNLTSLGWPLTADIRQELRSGHGLPTQITN